jgi:tetraacyldisaccharide-1-P 4'-kinase
MSLSVARNTLDQSELALTQLHDRKLAVLAGIAAPERVYRSLRALGLEFRELNVGDHGRISETELHALYAGECHVLCTEKDAVKYAAHQNLWSLPLGYVLDTAVWDWVVARLKHRMR